MVYLPSITPFANHSALPRLSNGLAAGQNRAKFSAESVSTSMQAFGSKLCNRFTATCSIEISPMLLYSSTPFPKPVSTMMRSTMMRFTRLTSCQCFPSYLGLWTAEYGAPLSLPPPWVLVSTATSCPRCAKLRASKSPTPSIPQCWAQTHRNVREFS